MANLDEYIESQKQKGRTDEEIYSSLRKAGWSEEDLDMHTQDPDNMPPPPPPGKHTQVQGHFSFWISFEHILLFISLYVLSTSIGALLFRLIDYFITDLNRSSYSSNSLDDYIVKGSIASIIVSLPIFSFVFINIQKQIDKNPAIRQLKGRKMLIYLTLVGTFVIMLWQVIFLVFGFLTGNIILSTILKFLVVVSIAGFIFAYYFHETREDRQT